MAHTHFFSLPAPPELDAAVASNCISKGETNKYPCPPMDLEKAHISYIWRLVVRASQTAVLSDILGGNGQGVVCSSMEQHVDGKPDLELPSRGPVFHPGLCLPPPCPLPSAE